MHILSETNFCWEIVLMFGKPPLQINPPPPTLAPEKNPPQKVKKIQPSPSQINFSKFSYLKF